MVLGCLMKSQFPKGLGPWEERLRGRRGIRGSWKGPPQDLSEPEAALKTDSLLAWGHGSRPPRSSFHSLASNRRGSVEE